MFFGFFLNEIRSLDFAVQIIAAARMLNIDVCQQISNKIVLLMQVGILEAGHLQQEFIETNKMPHLRYDLLLLERLILLDHVFRPFEVESQFLLILGGNIPLVKQFVGFFDIIRVKHGVRINLRLQIVNRRRRYGSGEQRSRIIRCKCRFDIFVCICKVQHKGFLLERRADTVQAGERLNGRHTLQLFENIHSAELRLVKPSLILVCNQKHLVFVLVKFLRQTIFRETVHGSLGIFGFIVRELYLAGKRHQSLNVRVSLLLGIVLKSLTVLHSALSGCGDDHCLCHAAEFGHYGCAEMLHDDLHPLGNVRFMQLHETGNLSLCIDCFAPRVFFDFLVDLIESVISRVVLKHIKNKSFLNGLLHGIDMERFTLTFCVQTTEQLNGRRLRCGSESKHGHVGLFAVSADLVCNHIFHIGSFLLSGTKRLCDRCHVLTCGGGMCLIDNNRKTLVFQPCNAVHNIREFLDRGGDDFRIAVQCNGKVGRVALIVHNTDKSCFVLHAHNGFL